MSLGKSVTAKTAEKSREAQAAPLCATFSRSFREKQARCSAVRRFATPLTRLRRTLDPFLLG
jgi:hypothetical protein